MAPSPKNPKIPSNTQRRPRRGRIWLRCTEEEWDAINETAEREGVTVPDWIMSCLLTEARDEKKAGRFRTKGAYRRNRMVKGEVLTLERKHNIYCSLEEQELVDSVAAANGKSTNFWAMRVIQRELKESELKAQRLRNAILTEEGTLTPQAEADIRAGRYPPWLRQAIKLASKKD